MKKETIYLISSSLLICLLLYLLDQVWQVNYGVKTGAKILFFLAAPAGYRFVFRKGQPSRRLTLPAGKELKYSILVGVFSFAVVTAAYLLLRSFIDLPGIVSDLEGKSKVTADNFLLAGAYITFINSFLEEIFFRGFLFLNLYEKGRKKTAWIYSSLMFALYHISIFKSWFSPGILMTAVAGLVFAGLLFNYMNRRTRTVFNSWLAHMMADAAIIWIGWRMF
ncbi:MAG: CPBP family intramembrane metalloprotease [Peptostreptococcaceae bacterium]|nr:CPBP family intramembrane metalloprotease [Peptostreptococcaceae bacterium]